MAIIEIDIGNTRLKWRLRRAAEVGPSQALVREDFSGPEDLLSALTTGVQLSLQGERVEQVLVGSVAAEEVAASVARWTLQQFGVEAEFACVTESCSGIRVGYEDPERLGVDRWLALLAAGKQQLDGVVVIDCGSAITIDVLHKGAHSGGYIVPGFQMMRAALFQDTARVRAAVSADVDMGPGKNTDAAVNNGLSAMVAGFVLKILADLKSQGWWGDRLKYKVLVTGGDAEKLSALLESEVVAQGWPVEVVDDLVMNGLELVVKRHWPWG